MSEREPANEPESNDSDQLQEPEIEPQIEVTELDEPIQKGLEEDDIERR